MAYLATKLPGAAKNCGVRYEGELCQVTTDGVVFPELLPALIDPWIKIEEGKSFKGKLTAKQQLEAQNKGAKDKVAAAEKLKAEREAKQTADAEAKNKKREPKPQSKRKKKTKKKVAKKSTKKKSTKKPTGTRKKKR